MEVRNCKGCGRLFNYIAGSAYTNYCPRCVDNLEEKFQIAKKYIEEHQGARIEEVAEVAEVKRSQIEHWVREERLCFSDDSLVGVSCNHCGKMIKSGYYCEECKNSLAKTLGNVYKRPEQEYKLNKTNNNARMRYLDNN